MTAKIILIANQKGGAGKTTVSMQLGGFLANVGFKTIIIDGDPQGTAIRWANSAPDEYLFPATVVSLSAAGEKIHREIKNFVDDFHYIVIDSPPAAESNIAQSALLVADLCIIPVLPSPPDIWATVAIKDAIGRALVINEALKSRILVNQLQSNSVLGNEVIKLLSTFDIPILESTLGLRSAYKESAAYGQTVATLGSKAKKAIDEMNSFINEIQNILK
jgi:chromosome partitioning protein